MVPNHAPWAARHHSVFGTRSRYCPSFFRVSDGCSTYELIELGGFARTCTPDTVDFNHMLYYLSYKAMAPVLGVEPSLAGLESATFRNVTDMY